MNDLDQLRAMRADAPYPAGYQLAAGRTRLLSAAVARRSTHRMPWMAVAGGLIAASAAAAVVLIGVRAPGDHTRQPGAMHLVSAVQVLDRAAAAATQRPAVMPGPHQWLYVKGVKSAATTSFVMAGWIRFDGQESATLENGKLIIYPGNPQDARLLATPQAAARFLASLPVRPKALLAVIYRKADAQPRDQWVSSNPDARAFSFLETLLSNAPVGVPPAHQAAAFRAMALIPGVVVRTGLRDAVGRPAIGLGFAPGNGLTGYMLLDPHTYVVSGLSYGQAGVARVFIAVVSRPGQR